MLTIISNTVSTIIIFYLKHCKIIDSIVRMNKKLYNCVMKTLHKGISTCNSNLFTHNIFTINGIHRMLVIQWALVYPTTFVPHEMCRIKQELDTSG